MKTCLRTKLLLIILASFLIITGCAIDSCDTNNDCPSGLHCRSQPNSDVNVCKPIVWKYSDGLNSQTPDYQSPISPVKPTQTSPPTISKKKANVEPKQQIGELE